MIRIKEAIIVEGKYDRIKLTSLFDTAIIETGGFRVFSDKEKKNVIREIAEKRGIVILTDSDGAGFVIRNYLKGIVGSNASIKQAYIPDIEGKEKRKAQPSKQGLLGVEGMTDDIIINAVKNCGACIEGENVRTDKKNITKTDLYNLGLTGRENSAQNRELVLKKLNFPNYMTTNALLAAVNMIYEKKEFEEIVQTVLSNN